MYSSELVFKFLRDKEYQTERGEQEYMMYFDVDMPRIINDFVNHIADGIRKQAQLEILDKLEKTYSNGEYLIIGDLEKLREELK
ncbi:MAG: hypothetical protein PHN69_04910 [Candidatus Pacebacteria bacterium]|nr:hypothetical protein [Candidatus Paceibacterota bacterium]